MTRHLIVFVFAAGCSRTATPEQACTNLKDRCGDLAALDSHDVVDCARDLPKLESTIGEADYKKFLGCVKRADSCPAALDCFGDVGKALGGKLTHDVLDDFKK